MVVVPLQHGWNCQGLFWCMKYKCLAKYCASCPWELWLEHLSIFRELQTLLVLQENSTRNSAYVLISLEKRSFSILISECSASRITFNSSSILTSHFTSPHAHLTLFVMQMVHLAYSAEKCFIPLNESCSTCSSRGVSPPKRIHHLQGDRWHFVTINLNSFFQYHLSKVKFTSLTCENPSNLRWSGPQLSKAVLRRVWLQEI